MSRWPRGEAYVEELLRRGELEHVTGAAGDGSLLLAQAERTAVTAAGPFGDLRRRRNELECPQLRRSATRNQADVGAKGRSQGTQ